MDGLVGGAKLGESEVLLKALAVSDGVKGQCLVPGDGGSVLATVAAGCSCYTEQV